MIHGVTGDGVTALRGTTVRGPIGITAGTVGVTGLTTIGMGIMTTGMEAARTGPITTTHREAVTGDT